MENASDLRLGHGGGAPLGLTIIKAPPQTCPRHGVCGQTTTHAAALPILTHIQSQSCLGLYGPQPRDAAESRVAENYSTHTNRNPTATPIRTVRAERAAQHNEQLAYAQGTQHGSSSCTKSIHHAPTTPPCA